MPQNLSSIHGATGLVVAVGDKGRILHFSGDIYEAVPVESPTRAHLSAVWVRSEREAWAVGEGGTVLHYDGAKWHVACMASRRAELNTIWGDRETGELWLAGHRTLIARGGDEDQAATLVRSNFTVLDIWGSSASDLWYLATERTLIHWNGTDARAMELPGEEGTEYHRIAGGAPDEPVWVAGTYGFLLRGDRQGWDVIDAKVQATLTGVLPLGEELWLTTDSGQLRHWDGHRWTTVAFSAFGGLSALCRVDGVIWACGARGVVLQHQHDDSGTKE